MKASALTTPALRRILLRALRVAAIVGTVLVLINQGDVILAGDFARLNLTKALLTYCVPFGVSAYSALRAAADADASAAPSQDDRLP